LVDEDNVKRIRRAKELIIANMAEPGSLNELAREVGLTLRRLKEGFKQIFGGSFYNFLFDHKMEYARRLLDSGQYNVNEIGLRIGYSTSSHFIAAFRKKIWYHAQEVYERVGLVALILRYLFGPITCCVG